ncbi:PilN domain-containing protein [Spongorhabdus nitratireducens]
MARINLLPWREERREERKKQFITMLMAFAFAGCGVIFVADGYVSDMLIHQQGRNQLIQNEINRLNGRIKEIDELKKKRAELLDRMEVIESLQGNRPIIVRIFDGIARAVPDGVYLTAVEMEKTELSISGVAESNTQVSAFMRQLDASEWFESPNLTAVNALDDDGRDGSKFEMTVQQTSPKAQDEDEKKRGKK